MRKKIEGNVMSIQVNGRWRTIGTIEGEKLIVVRDHLEHYSHRFGAYEFNAEVMRDDRTPPFIEVRLTVRKLHLTYLLSRQNILDYGIYDKKIPQIIFMPVLKMELLKIN